MKANMKYLIVFAAAWLFACSSHSEPPVTRDSTQLQDCYVPAAPGAIVGLGFNGQPRNLSLAGGANVRGALDMLVNDLGATFARVEVNDGETDWESTPDNSDPTVIDWTYFDAVFSTPRFLRLWAYVAYLNQLGIAHVELAQHGGIPLWMGTNTPPAGSTQTGYPGPADGRAYVLTPAMEDEFVETSVAMLLYARTRAPEPRPHFDLFSPWNEPEFAGFGEGLDVPTAQRARVLNKLATRMNALPDLTGIQLVVGEDGSEPGMIETRGAVQGDSLVMARTAATSFHRYSDASVWTQWNNANPPAWLTEFGSTWVSSCFDTTWTMALEDAGNLISALQNGVTAGLAWSDTDAPHSHQGNIMESFGLLATASAGKSGTQLCPDGFNDTQPSDAVLDAMTYTPKPTYLALRHAFHWIRPNATPITMTASGGVLAVAYKNADGTVAVFGRSSSAVNSTVTLTMASPPAYLTPRVTTATSTDVVGTPVPLTNGQGVFSLPAQSVFTLLSSPGSGTGGSGGQGGMGAGGASAGAGGAGQGGQSAGNGGVSGDGTAGTPAGGMSGSSGSDVGGQSGAGGASSGAGGMSSGGAGQGGAAAGTSSGGAGAGGAGAAGMAGSGGSGGGLPTLIAGWAFNETSGTTAADATGRGHTGTLVGSPVWTTGCKYGGCLTFSSTGKRVTVADANDLDLTTSWTLMAWEMTTTNSGWHPIMLKEGNSANTEAYLFYGLPPNGGWYVDGVTPEPRVQPSGTISTTAWTHVALVRTPTTLSYWVNGAQLGASVSVNSASTIASTGPLTIGGHTDWNGEWWSGKIDDVRIYNVALTSAQIAQVMGSGL